jgi:hypothetical protein
MRAEAEETETLKSMRSRTAFCSKRRVAADVPTGEYLIIVTRQSLHIFSTERTGMRYEENIVQQLQKEQ